MTFKFSIIAIAATVISGCLSMNTYVDPMYGDISYSRLPEPETVQPVELNVKFMVNGKHKSSPEKQLTPLFENALEQSGFFDVVSKDAPGKVQVTFHNKADIQNAMGEGFVTGLTFGAAGQAVTDYYEVTMVYTNGDSTYEKQYNHALHTTIGNHAAPIQNVDPMPLDDAVGAVIEDVVISFIADLSKEFVKSEDTSAVS